MPSDSRLVIAKVLAGAALALVTVYVLAGPQTMLPANVVGISTLVISAGAFVLSLKKRTYSVPVMLSANGIIHAVSAAIALGDTSVSASSGLIIAFIFGFATIGLGVANGIRIANTVMIKKKNDRLSDDELKDNSATTLEKNHRAAFF